MGMAVLRTQTPSPVQSHAKCANCSYDLHGLTERRCPECGSPFSLDYCRPGLVPVRPRRYGIPYLVAALTGLLFTYLSNRFFPGPIVGGPGPEATMLEMSGLFWRLSVVVQAGVIVTAVVALTRDRYRYSPLIHVAWALALLGGLWDLLCFFSHLD